MDIYIQPAKKIKVAGKHRITIKDVADVVAPPGVASKVEALHLLQIPEVERGFFLMKCTEMIARVTKAFPESTVSNVGAQETVVAYARQADTGIPWWQWVKVAAICLVLTIGAATAIMSFQTDSQLSKVFEAYYRMVYGRENATPLIIHIPYAVGLAVGIVGFFNHFAGKKLTQDPTPIEVEMCLYDQDIDDTVLEALAAAAEAREKNA